MPGRLRDRRFPELGLFQHVSLLEAEISRALDAYFGFRPDPAAPERAWAPPIDVYETRDDLVVSVELPGLQERDIHLAMTGDLLTLRGRRGPTAGPPQERYHRIERWSGPFERHIRLPIPVQTDRIRATYRDGVLEIRLPKRDEARPREIKIEVG